MLGFCPECNGKVSSTAPNCPHCGYVIQEPQVPHQKPKTSYKPLVFLALLGMCIAWSLARTAGDSSPAATTTENAAGESVPRMEIGDWTYGVTEKNDSWWRYAYTVPLKNNTARPIEVDVQVKFLDGGGLVIDDDREYGVIVGPNSEETLSGYDLVRMPGAANVQRAEVEIK